MTDLRTLGGSSSGAYAINESGHIAGTSRLPGDAISHAVIFIEGGIADLGNLDEPSVWSSSAWDINENGQAVGTSSVGFQNRHGFLYNYDGTMTDLGVLSTKDNSEACAINDIGQVVGYSWKYTGGPNQAFVYSNGVMTSLGALGSYGSVAFDINNSGQIVGSSAAPGGLHACLYYGGTVTDLNSVIDSSLGWELGEARSINDRGWIVGTGNHNGKKAAYLLTPIPEPSTLALLGIGAVSLLALAWRRNRKAA